MELYAVFEVDTGYDGYERLESLWISETNARTAMDVLKKQFIEGRKDSRYKQKWTEEPIFADEPDIIARYRLFDTANIVNKGETNYLVEIKILTTGD